jgi:tetratricopeptide (TPR) repeat protein
MRSPRFWLVLVAFEVVFGLAVFLATRSYYTSTAGTEPGTPPIAAATPAPGLSPWPNVALTLPSSAPPTSDDPQSIAREADELFAAKQYDRAAALYERLIALDAGNVGLYNNLGLTLHYLGRSSDALDRLAAGAALDPQHQRIWLTTGFVNLQLGKAEAARAALQKAASAGGDTAIRDSAEKMLATLP